MGVIPIKQDAWELCASCLLDPRTQMVDFGCLDRKRVDPTEQNAGVPMVESSRRHLKRRQLMLGGAMTPHHTHHR